ncbi:MAG: S9 family peptidase [Candidatus Aminicenantes bacterium]|nr:S9 family peptidase [Candidatus Aminicenantes bacterium]MBL7082549.1 S9 family peptidase [Candidatus Aminicenantes bacterium]
MKSLKCHGRWIRSFFVYAVISLLFLMSFACSKKVKPPVAEKIPKELTIHEHTRVDNYYWLNERENPKVIDYLKAENEYKEAVMKHTEEFQETLFNEIVGRIKKTDMSVPYKDSGYYRYSRYVEGNEYPIYCRKKGSLEANEEILLNVNEMAEGYDFYNVAGYSESSNNNLIAFGVDTVSRRKYTIYFKNLTTEEMLLDKIPNTTGRAVWANDNKTVFYSIKDKTLRSYKILKHVLGTDVSSDKEVYHEKDVTFSTYIYKTKSKKYLIIGCGSTLSSEYRFLDASEPDGKFKIIQTRERDLEYSVDHFRNKFYIRTNYKAKNFRLMETSVWKTTKENWKEVIPHREDVLLQGYEIFKDFLVVNERIKGLPNIRVIRWDKKGEHYLNFGEETYSASISTNPEFDTDLLRYSYTSLTTPGSVFDYNMNTREKKLLKQQEVLGDFDSASYFTERLYATAKDGTKVPISLVYRKGLEKNGDNPLLLYGYGSYGASMNAGFRSDRLSLLDRGFVYAIAHIRGGQEMGRYWYDEGKLLKKKNTFTDFIACAEHLIAEKFTNSNKLFVIGGSAGGLLMGAIANMQPDLFKGIIAAVPWVDVITTMLDDSIPLTTAEYDEWGNPNDKEYYDYMLSYSPYDNVEAKDYPAMLVTTGLHDSQVQYFEPAKWAAKLRDLKTDNNILLLHTNMEAGHGGVSGRFRRYRETAMEYAFMLDLIGINK